MKFLNSKSAIHTAVAVVFLLLAVVPNLNPFIEPAVEYNEEVFSGTLVIATSLRLINSALSFMMDVNAKAGAIVAGVDFSPAKTLEPMDDAVERASNFMFFISVTSGVIALSLPIAAVFGASVASVGYALSSVMGLLSKQFQYFGRYNLYYLAENAKRFGLLFAILLPAAYATGGWLGNVVTAQALFSAEQVIEGSADESKAVVDETVDIPTVPTQDESVIETPVQNIIPETSQLSDEVDEIHSSDNSLSNPDELDLPAGSDGETSTGVLGWVTEQGRALQQYGDDAVGASSDAIGNIAESTADLADRVADGASDLATRVRDAAENIATGTVAQLGRMMSMVGAYADTLSDLAVAMLQVAAAYLVKLVVLPALILFGLYKLFIPPIPRIEQAIDDATSGATQLISAKDDTK